MANMIKTVVVDVAQTFEGPMIFLGCEQKMVNQDRKDASSPSVPDYGKWTVEFMVRPIGDEGKVGARENIKVTIKGDKNPCEALSEFDRVSVEGLQYNVMTSERGVAQVFWRVRAVRPFGSANSNNGALRGQTSITS